MPLEIKSGRMFWTQDTQVILYSFLLSDRYNIEVRYYNLFHSMCDNSSIQVNTGLLYSLADKGMKEIVIDRGPSIDRFDGLCLLLHLFPFL